MSRAERSRARYVAYGFLGLVVLLAAIPGYLVLTPVWRTVAMRVVAALIVVAASVRVLGAVRRTVEGAGRSLLDAPAPPPRGAVLDERYLRLRDDVRFSVHRRRYFDTFLWPRLCAFGVPLTPPPLPRRSRRGPSLAALERLITEVEERS